MHVLYVEDNVLDADLTRRFLRKSGAEIELDVVGTISEGLLQLKGQPNAYDLVLTDLNLPDGDGLALLTQIRSREWPLPVVVITGLGDDETVLAAVRAGADDYLVKREGYLESLASTLRAAQARFTSEHQRRTRALRVVYAEDDPDAYELTVRQFSRLAPHLRLSRVSTGTEALARLTDASPDDLPDVFLLDYQLPDLSGLDVLKALGPDFCAHVPVVVLTAHREEDIALQVLRFGAADYVVKDSGYLVRLGRVIESVAYRVQLVREQEALHESREKLRLAYAESQRQLAEQTLLYECAQALSEARVIEDVYAVVLSRMVLFLRGTSGAFLVGDAAGVAAEVVFEYFGPDASPEESASALHAGWPLRDYPTLARVRGAGRPLVLQHDDPDLSPAEAQAVANWGVQTIVVIPCTVGDDLLGYFEVFDTRQTRTYDEATLRGLFALAQQAALKMENIKLVRSLEHSVYQAHELARVAQSASQLKSEFLSNTSHELRSPLTNIQGSLSMVLDGMCIDSDDERRWLQQAYSASEVLQRFITDLLEFAQIEGGHITLDAQPFDVQLLIEEVLGAHKARAKEKNLALLVNYPAGPAIHALVDYTKARRVLGSLVDNALKFTDAGFVAITIVSNMTSGYVDLHVQDSGVGIDVTQQAKVFEPFVQADGSTTRRYAGAGLGLSLARRLAEFMGGTLTLSSPGAGQGTTVTFRLPLAVVGELASSAS
jgi:signal transduction histidine kinase/CheY-like chemotaxis protein